MPRTNLASVIPSTSGLDISGGADTAGDVANGNEFDNDGNVIIKVRNADGGSAHFLSVACPLLIDGNVVANVATSIPALATRFFGPFRTAIYNQDNGRAGVNVDSAQLFIKCIRIPEVQ
jgi:hypothetical protein